MPACIDAPINFKLDFCRHAGRRILIGGMSKPRRAAGVNQSWLMTHFDKTHSLAGDHWRR